MSQALLLTKCNIYKPFRRRFFLVFFLLFYYLRKVKLIPHIKMKKLLYILVLALLPAVVSQAQTEKKNGKKNNAEETIYAAGTVPVINGKVTFEKTIEAKGLTAKEVEEKVNQWIDGRYVKPTVISVKRFESEKPGTIIIKGEEYITFKSTFFVLSRARMYYYLTLTPGDGCCQFNLSRITYWYDDEDEKGGVKMIAEDWITDENAFDKKGKMKKFEGKFRRKTIDLKEMLIEELTNVLN